MNFDYSPEQQVLAQSVRALLEDKSLPKLDMQGPNQPQQIKGYLKPWLTRLGRIGYLTAAVGPARTNEWVSLLLAQKELACFSSEIYLCAETGSRLIGSLLTRYGSAQQQKQFLKPLLDGEWIGALALSEANAGSSPKALATVVQPAPSGYCLNGEKNLVAMAPMADLFLVFAQKEERPVLCLLTPSDPGVEIGAAVPTMGYQSLCVAPIHLKNVGLASERIISLSCSLQDLVSEFRQEEDAVLTGASLGLIWRCYEEAKTGANVPHTDGKPSAAHQTIRFALAEMLALAQTADLLSQRALAARSGRDRESKTLLLCAKVFASETAVQLAQRALQILAASGYRSGSPVERALRDAFYGPMAGHTSEVARVAIADAVLEHTR